MKILLSILFAVALCLTGRAADIVGIAGQRAVMSVTSDGTPPFTYQWKKNGADIAGATEATYIISPLNAGSPGSYSCQVTNPAGSTRSDSVVLTVILPPTKATASGVIESIIAWLRKKGYTVTKTS